MTKVEIFRKKYPKFIYQGYDYKIFKNDLKIFFDFQISNENRPRFKDIIFKPELIIKNTGKKIPKNLDNFIFHLGLMEIPTYWKATCSPIIEIKAGHLNKEQIKWWQDFILKGLGQFFYENQINFTKPNFLKIKNNHSFKKSTIVAFLNAFEPKKEGNRVLIPMGEGKDSIVTLELLKRKNKKINCFIVNPQKNHFKILKIAGIYPVKPLANQGIPLKTELFNRVKKPIIVERKIDKKLLELNQKGFLNGHTPITAVISNLAVFCAFLFGYNQVAMSCEKSADESNIKYLGKNINHQWSKSSQFEKEFQKYIRKHLTKDINYFSFLRPFHEIGIAKIFSKFPEYFPVFLSCNEARKTKSGTKKPSGQWCGSCSKCLFIWTILYPFVEKNDLIKIFKKNLFEDKNLIPIMKQLIGESGYAKPLECVGTQKESLIAFYLSWKKTNHFKKYPGGQKLSKLPVVLQYFEKKILPSYPHLEKNVKNFNI